MAVDSIKSDYPSESKPLMGIIRDVEAKMFSAKRETKKIAMHFEINRKLFKHPENAEYLIHLRNVSALDYFDTKHMFVQHNN